MLDALKKSADNNWSSPDRVLQGSVINLDDSYGLPSPSERNIVVKVRTRSGMRRFTMKAVSITAHYTQEATHCLRFPSVHFLYMFVILLIMACSCSALIDLQSLS